MALEPLHAKAQYNNSLLLMSLGRHQDRSHIEAAYVTMWERYQRGEPPESFAVASIEN